MKLEDRLTTHFAETSSDLTGHTGQVASVVGAAATRSRLIPVLIGGALLSLSLVAVASVVLVDFFDLPAPVGTSQDASDDVTRIVVSPYVELPNRLVEVDDEPIFTVTTEWPSYWRLAALNHYEDDIWKVEGDFEASSPWSTPDATEGGDRIILRQDYEISSLAAIWLPVAPEPVEITTDDVAIEADSQIDTVVVSFEYPDSDGLSYTVVSSVAVPTPEQLRQAASVDRGNLDSAHFSTVGIPTQVGDLARELTDGLATDYDKVLALQNHLRTYDNRVDPGQAPPGADPITELLQNREGTAREFASVFALMSRELGIPSRVAVGFTPGEPVESEGPATESGWMTFEVSNSNAHAWPELYFEGIGWIGFEPTPGRSMPMAEGHTGVLDAGD